MKRLKFSDRRTGAVPRRPVLDLTDDAVGLDAWDVLRGETPPSGRVVVPLAPVAVGA